MVRTSSNLPLLAGAFGLGLIISVSTAYLWPGSGEAQEAGKEAGASAMAEPVVVRQPWSFAGMRGAYDQAQLQRGFKVFEEVCSKCHAANLLKFRNLGEEGGPGFNEGQVKTLAAKAEIEDGPNADGEMFKRPGRPSDGFPSPYANDNAARAANNGALPPDMSVIAKARALHVEHPWYIAPFHWVRDIASGYQEGGPDYIHALLTSYKDEPPAGLKDAEGNPFKLQDGMNYNEVFDGHQIAMPNPLSADGLVDYTDGTPTTVDQYARDVSSYLMWMAEPTLNERKSLGIRVLLYLGVLTLLLGLAKRAVWARVPH